MSITKEELAAMKAHYERIQRYLFLPNEPDLYAAVQTMATNAIRLIREVEDLQNTLFSESHEEYDEEETGASDGK